MVKKTSIENDPHFNVVKQRALKWHRTMLSHPTWEEAREFHAIIELGYFIMTMKSFEPRIEAVEKGYIQALEWISRCKKNGIFVFSLYERAVKSYEEDHGPRESWSLEPESSYTSVQGSIDQSRKDYRKNLKEAMRNNGNTTQEG